MTKVIIIMVAVIAFLSYKFYESCKEKALFKKVKWCVTCDSFSGTAPEREMIKHIFYLQGNLSVEKKYRITEDEYYIIIDILKSYQQNLIQRYFADTLPNDNHDNRAYFVITLRDFLEKHQCDTTFNGEEMYTTKDYKSYDTWGVTSFSATYALTDYAVTYNKVLYISQLYFLRLYNIVGESKLGVISANTTKEAIDSREIKVNNF